MSLHETTIAKARATDPETSWDAAETVKNINAVQKAIMELLEAHRMTDEELVDQYILGMLAGKLPMASESGIRTRRDELVRAGKVGYTGEKRPTRSGRQARIWAVV